MATNKVNASHCKELAMKLKARYMEDTVTYKVFVWSWDKLTNIIARRYIQFAMIMHDIAHEE